MFGGVLCGEGDGETEQRRKERTSGHGQQCADCGREGAGAGGRGHMEIMVLEKGKEKN